MSYFSIVRQRVGANVTTKSQQQQQQAYQSYCRKWSTTTIANEAATSTATQQQVLSLPKNVVISRQAFLQYQQQQQQQVKNKVRFDRNGNVIKPSMIKGKKKKIEETTPWPKNIVYGAYVASAICIPYTIAWFLSSNEKLRSVLFSSSSSSSSSGSSYYAVFSNRILEWMRHHFGTIDYGAISEPEFVTIQQQKVLGNNNNVPTMQVPYKLIDEATQRIRQQQTYIEQTLNQGTVKFRLSVPGTGSTTISQQEQEVLVYELPANTLARTHDILSNIRKKLSLSNNNQSDMLLPKSGPIALDFIDYDDEVKDAAEDEVPNSVAFDSTTITVPSMSIYSLWHYQPPIEIPNENGKGTTKKTKKNETTSGNKQHVLSNDEIELLRIKYEIQQLQRELSNSQTSYRSIDTIQDEIRQLQKLKRQILWKQWRLW